MGNTLDGAMVSKLCADTNFVEFSHQSVPTRSRTRYII